MTVIKAGALLGNWHEEGPPPAAAPRPRHGQAAFDPGEARDDHGKWTGGGLLPKGPETPIPAGHPASRILDTWVTQGGSGKLSAVERDTVNAAVGYYGKQAPDGLVRGEHDQPPSRYKTGKVLTLAPASFSTEETSALPYAEAGDRNPAVLHVTRARGLKGLNVSARAEAEGFNEQEWVVAAKFKVTGSHVDGDGITHVQIAYAANVRAATAAGTTPEAAAGAIRYAGGELAAQVHELLRARWPAGYREAVNTSGAGKDAVVPASRLRTVMPQPYPERVDGYRAELRAGRDIGPSLAVRHAGHLILVDGTHRAAARVLEGQRAIPATVLNLP